MSDDRRKIIERYAGRPSAPAESVEDEKSGDDYEASSHVNRNHHPEIMLELRFKTSDSLALAYALLISVKWNPSEGVVLQFTTHQVVLIGRNLKEIHSKLVRHRLSYIQELSSPHDDQPEESAVVASIQVTAW